MRSLYWKIHYALMKLHFRKYRKYPPEVVWNRKYKCWLHTSKPFETAWDANNVEDVIGEVFEVGLCYPFDTDGYWNHSHNFGDALRAAHDCKEEFKIADDYAECYSQQEIDMLKAVVEKSANLQGLPNKKFTLGGKPCYED